MSDFEKGDVINGEYRILKLMASGSFGQVFQGKAINERIKVAIKVEKQEMAHHLSLKREIEIIEHLAGTPQVPRILWHGKSKGHSVMVVNLLKYDLVYFLKKHNKFTEECIGNIASDMIGILENVHNQYLLYLSRNVIHRDIKPENILVDHSLDKLYLIDFGVSKILGEPNHSTKRINFIGTSRYASISAHQGMEQHKRDDLESLGYVLIYMLTRKLPWMNIEEKDQAQRLNIIGQLKSTLPIETICANASQQLLIYMRLVKQLSPTEQPKYNTLKQVFSRYKSDTPFDWSLSIQHENMTYKTQKKPREYQQKANEPIFVRDSSISQQQQQNQLFLKATTKSSKTVKSKNSSASQRQIDHSNIFQKKATTKSDRNLPSMNSSDDLSIRGQDRSIDVRFTNTQGLFLITQKQIQPTNPVIDSDIYMLQNDEFISFRAQQELLQFENQDLEIKYNLLHFRSVYYNHKNPIDKYLTNARCKRDNHE